MKITHDKVANALYFYLKTEKIVKTLPVNECVNIDLDENGEVVGIEILYLSSKQGLEPGKSIKDGIPVEVISGTPVTV